MAAGGRSHLPSSIPNWGETQMEPLLREAPWNRLWSFWWDSCLVLLCIIRSWRWNHPLWDPILTHTRWPWRSWAAHFWSQGAPQRHLWPGIRFWTPRELTPETTLSSRGDLCLMGRQTNTRKWCCSIRALSNRQWGYNQQRLGKSGAKCSRRSMQLTKFPFPNSWSNDVKGYHRCDVILLRAQVEG